MGLIFYLLELLFTLLSIVIIIRALSSWIFHDPYSKYLSLLIKITEPILAPTRKLLMRYGVSQKLPVDISPMVAIVILSMLSMFVKFVSYIFR